MEHGSHFTDILDAHVAAAFRAPMGEPPVLDARPDPAIRFAMWGGGVPLSSGAGASAGYAWSGVKVRGVSPWATDGYRATASASQPAGRTGRSEATTTRHEAAAQGDIRSESSWAGATSGPSVAFGFRPRAGHAPAFESHASKPAAPRVQRVLTATDRAALDTLRRLGAAALTDSYTDEELKAAYRHLAFQLHPDQHPEADAAARLELGRRFSQLHSAYRRLAGR